MEILKRFTIISSLACLSVMNIAQAQNLMSAPVYTQKIQLSAANSHVWAYFDPNIDCDTCITKNFNDQGMQFYFQYMVPKKTVYGKVPATLVYEYHRECTYEIELPFKIESTGEFIMPSGKYVSKLTNNSPAYCNQYAPIPMNVGNGENVTLISWG